MLRFESYRRGIVWSSLINVAAQGLVLLASIVFAGLFGTQSSTDVYFYSVSVVTLISGFLTSIDNGVILPEAMRLAEQVDRLAAMRFVNFFLYAFLVLSGALTALLLMWPLEIFRTLSGFEPGLLSQHRDIVLWTIPLCGLLLLSQFLLDVLSAYKFFTLPMLFSVLNRLLVLLSMLSLHEQVHVLSIVWASLVATALQIGLCLFLMKKALGWQFRLTDRRLDGRVVRNIGFALSGSATAMVATGVPVALLSGFPAGVLTAMSFAQRLASVPMTLLAGQISQVMGIRFNEEVARRDWPGVNRSFASSVRACGVLLIPAALFLFVFADNVVLVCFQRGSFDARSTILVSTFFRFFALALPFTGINMLIGRVFMAGQRIREGVYYQILFNAFSTVLIVLSLRAFGAVGYPAAHLAVYAANLLMVSIAFRFLFPQIAYGHALASLAPLFASNGCVAAAAWVLKRLWTGGSDLVVLTVGFLLCSALPLWQARQLVAPRQPTTDHPFHRSDRETP
ncbi:MAG: hypothetical protein MUF10_01845 [Thermoanaerobaculaceae bacterium]|nr:hypothetical protein [Thermoanaerobaculaceae bacterium]